VKQAHRRAISDVTVGHIDALAAAGAYELSGMANGCAHALGLPDGRDFRPESYYWRCMNRMVFVCAIGANIPCGAKADLAKRNLGADKYCQDNPEATFVPAYATGHETLFAWSCSRAQFALTPSTCMRSNTSCLNPYC
jgi:hypothetical protein